MPIEAGLAAARQRSTGLMAMRGEMMKAMGDIMLKYAQRAQAVK